MNKYIYIFTLFLGIIICTFIGYESTLTWNTIVSGRYCPNCGYTLKLRPDFYEECPTCHYKFFIYNKKKAKQIKEEYQKTH